MIQTCPVQTECRRSTTCAATSAKTSGNTTVAFSHFLKRAILIPDHDPTSPVAENRGSDQTGRREGIEGTVPEVQHPAATAPGRLKKSWLMGVILLTLRSNQIEGYHKQRLLLP